jgi:triacylglycerol lipase
MIPFDGQFAEETMLPLAEAAYDATHPPQNYTLHQKQFALTAYDILADANHPAIQRQLSATGTVQKVSGQNVLQSMLEQPRRHQGTTTDAQVKLLAAAPPANLHFGWFCLDQANQTVILAFRGTEYIHDWMDDFDFIPAPYAPVPGRGTVHQGFQLVYLTIRNNLVALLNKYSSGYTQIFITGHSLGGALCALAAVDVLNINSNLAPVVYTWAEPRVGHDDFVTFYNTHVNICYRVVNVWDVVPHLPPEIAGYQHEGSQVTIDSGFSLDVVHNHVLATGYVPGMAKWNHDHPVQPTQHFGRMALSALVGQSR